MIVNYFIKATDLIDILNRFKGTPMDDLDSLYKQAGTLNFDIEILKAKLNETYAEICRIKNEQVAQETKPV